MINANLIKYPEFQKLLIPVPQLVVYILNSQRRKITPPRGRISKQRKRQQSYAEVTHRRRNHRKKTKTLIHSQQREDFPHRLAGLDMAKSNQEKKARGLKSDHAASS